MPVMIHNSTKSGTDTSNATATESDIASGKTAYVNGRKLTGIAAVCNRRDVVIDCYIDPSASSSYSGVIEFPRGYVPFNVYVHSYNPDKLMVTILSIDYLFHRVEIDIQVLDETAFTETISVYVDCTSY